MRTIITDHAEMRYMQRKNPQSRPREEIPELFRNSREVKWENRKNQAKFNAEENIAFAYKRDGNKYIIFTVLRLTEEEIEYAEKEAPAPKPQEVKYA
jgi:hypothetical protein